MINSYSRTWFELFLETRAYTEQEIAFIVRNLPNPPYRKILDLCCGEGRHTNPLAREGYEMVGVDMDAEALRAAASVSEGRVKYIQRDMQELRGVAGQFEAILLLWQSFGYFDDRTNRDILQQVSEKLSTGGRFILDIYNRSYWVMNQGERRVERKGVEIRIENRMIGKRLRALLEYGSGLGGDLFEWQLYTLDEIIGIGKEFNMVSLFSCTEYDERKPVSNEKPMMQIVFEKQG